MSKRTDQKLPAQGSLTDAEFSDQLQRWRDVHQAQTPPGSLAQRLQTDYQAQHNRGAWSQWPVLATGLVAGLVVVAIWNDTVTSGLSTQTQPEAQASWLTHTQPELSASTSARFRPPLGELKPTRWPTLASLTNATASTRAAVVADSTHTPQEEI